MRSVRLLCAVLAVASPLSARAHVTLENQQAPVGSTYKAVLRVPHGCAGAATIRLRVQIPEGVIAVKPMPKPGWTLETKRAQYERAYDYFRTPQTEGVREIVWSGGNLPDAWYDEFVFRAYLASTLPADNSLYVPVVQECEDGRVHRWIEVPAAGKSADDYKQPAPAVKLLPAKAN